MVTLEQEVESKDELKNKLELSVEVERTKATSLQQDLHRLNQFLADMDVSFHFHFPSQPQIVLLSGVVRVHCADLYY